MSYFKLSILIILIYFNISCLNNQDIIANAKAYKTVDIKELYETPMLNTEKHSGFEILEEELPELKNNNMDSESNNLDDEFYSSKDNKDYLRIGLLLPLSEKYEALGESMLKSIELALFNSGNKKIKLIIEDTKGTRIGSKIATQIVISKRADIILGPIFSETTKEAKKIAHKNDLKLISFSNNWRLADKDTYLMGFMPYYQIIEILSYASSQDYNKLAVILPDNIYGDLVEEILKLNSSIEVVKMERLKDDDNIQNFVEKFSGYDKREQQRAKQITFYQTYIDELLKLEDEINNKDLQDKMSDEEFFKKYAKYKELKNAKGAIQREIDSLKNNTADIKLDFNCILLPFGGDKLREIASLLSYYDISHKKVKYLGTGLFDDKSLNDEPALIGAWYATAYSTSLKGFKNSYNNVFNESPIRIASIGYDAVSLLSMIANNKEKNKENYLDSLDDSSFIGIDGKFKFNKRGLIERNLSIMEIQKNKNPKKIFNK